MKWLNAAADEIVGCIKSSIKAFSMEPDERLIKLMLEAKEKKISARGSVQPKTVSRSELSVWRS